LLDPSLKENDKFVNFLLDNTTKMSYQYSRQYTKKLRRSQAKALEMRTLMSDVTFIDQQCHACGKALCQEEAEEFEGRTDGTADDLLYCSAHLPSYLTLCLECCGVYTANLGGTCRYCLEDASNGEG
jgi:hypothetical protein